MDLDFAAIELGRLIAQTPEYKYYSQAAKDVDEDEETSELLKNLKTFEEKVLASRKAGQEPGEELKKEYTEMLEKVQSKSRVQSLLATQDNYLKLMDKVNEKIALGIREGSQSRIITNF